MSSMEQEQAMLVQKRRRNVIDGAFYEPRILYDAFTVNAGTLDQKIIENQDEWPIRITHMIASVAPLSTMNQDIPLRGDERILSMARVKVTAQDQPFFNNNRFLMGVFGNVVTASPQANAGLASWTLPKILRYGGRDTLDVAVELLPPGAQNGGRVVSLMLSGNGRKSGVPYVFQGDTGESGLLTTADVFLDEADFKLSAAEMVDIDTVGVHVSGELTGTTLQGDARRALIQIRQNGNGTNTDWFHGPVDRPKMLASLLGVSCGRSIVRALPYDAQDQERGLLLYPDQALNVEMDLLPDIQRLDDEEIWLGFAGYAIVT